MPPRRGRMTSGGRHRACLLSLEVGPAERPELQASKVAAELTPVPHAADVPYVFGIATQKNNYTAAAEAMGIQMMDYWYVSRCEQAGFYYG